MYSLCWSSGSLDSKAVFTSSLFDGGEVRLIVILGARFVSFHCFN